jgi:hypothetical protein
MSAPRAVRRGPVAARVRERGRAKLTGDRMHGMMLSFLVAVATQRAFFIEWQDAYLFYQMNRVRWYHPGDRVSYPRSREGYIVDAHPNDVPRLLLDFLAKHDKPDVDSLRMRTNAGWCAGELPQTLAQFSEAVAPIVRMPNATQAILDFLFRPSRPVARTLARVAEQERLYDAHPLAGVHVRLGGEQQGRKGGFKDPPRAFNKDEAVSLMWHAAVKGATDLAAREATKP